DYVTVCFGVKAAIHTCNSKFVNPCSVFGVPNNPIGLKPDIGIFGITYPNAAQRFGYNFGLGNPTGFFSVEIRRG
ncbi:MAG TPA: hypothetical protein VKN36_12530, partial [Eudoraea sp.]|nr:hypothetical protein [Eudoraea sp.]